MAFETGEPIRRKTLQDDDAPIGISSVDVFSKLATSSRALGILKGMHVFRRTGDEGSTRETMVTQARRIDAKKIAVFVGFNAIGIHPNPELMNVERLNIQAFRFMLYPERTIGTQEITVDRPKGSKKSWPLEDKGPFVYLHEQSILDVRNWHPKRLALPEGPALHVPIATEQEVERTETLSARIGQFSPVDEIKVFSMLPQTTVQ